MKKIFFILSLFYLISDIAKCQPVIAPLTAPGIPFDLTLQEILRINVISGGNIEFVFNTISQYNSGILNSPFYNTTIQISSSSNWQLHFGAESDLLGTDDPANSIDKNNVGFTVSWTGGNTCCAVGDNVSSQSINCSYNNSPLGNPNGLALFTGAAGDILFTNGTGNAGDVGDNAFTIQWECGTGITTGTTPMNASSLLGKKADRYITTVFLDLEAL